MDINDMIGRGLKLPVLAVAFAACALPAASAIAAAAPAGALDTELSAADNVGTLSGGERVTVRLTFKNTTHQDVYIISYETPLRGLERDLFVVERDGERMPYTGIVAFRAGPSQEDWIHVAPGSEVSRDVDISSVYDTSRAGTYTVRYNAVQEIHRGNVPSSRTGARGRAKFAGQSVTTAPVSLTLSESYDLQNEVDPFAAPEGLPDSGTLGTDVGTFAFYGCSNTSVITSAQSTARSRAQRAYNAATSFNTWYRTWFGNTSSYVSTVRSRFGNATTRLGQNIDYYCGSYAPYCSGSIIAYTYKTTSNRIYLCNAFFSYSDKGHVIGHEAYHWNTVAGADDVTYGYSQCRSLAQSRPYDALRNADNYAYAADYAP